MNLSPNHGLQARQQKIQEKRKQTPWRNFVMEIASWYPFGFYKNQGLISKYHPDNGRINRILKSKDYEIERNNGYNKDIDDSNQSFFDTFTTLLFGEVHESLKQFPNCENSEYVDIALGAKNAYLSSCVLGSEQVAYSVQVKNNCNNVFNSMLVYDNCNNVFCSHSIVKSFNVFYSSTIQNSSNLWFCANIINCSECILCEGLENQSYCIQNKQLSKEEYQLQKESLLLQKENFNKIYTKVLEKKGMNTGENISGQSNILCADIENGFYNYAVQDARNVCLSGDGTLMKNIYDAFSTGSLECHDYYAVMGVGYNANHIYCCIETALNVSSCYYCYYIESCSFCLGCVGLKNKSYCIFNKQYTKEERTDKANEIFSAMDEQGVLGDFFPPSMNPFYFNDTAAYLIDNSFTKEEVTAKGYLRRDEPIKVDIPDGMKIINIDELQNYEGRITDSGQFISSTTIRNSESEIKSSYNRSINPDILKVIIQDEQGNIYKIVKMEYDFLMKHGLPLPRKHRLDRMKENFKIN